MSKRIANLAALYQKVAMLHDIAFDRVRFNSMAQALEKKIADRQGRPIDWNNWNSFIATLSDEEEQELNSLAAFVDHQLRFYRPESLVRYQVTSLRNDGASSSEFMTLSRAGQAYDSNWADVSVGEWVLQKDFSLRPITKAERQEISDKADEWSASK